ncbi:unnamed protein product [Lota lota]
MDPASNPVLPGTPEGASVSLEEKEEEEEEEKKEEELYLPGVGESSGIHEPDHPGQNGDLVDGRTAADGADRTTAAPRAPLGLDDADQPHRCGGDDGNDDDGRRDECPICNERFGSSGDRRVALLHCDHALCHRCLSRILERARDPSRVRCPFCRQSTALSSRDFAQMMLVMKAYDENAREATAPGASSSYSSAPLLAGVQPGDPQGTPQAPLGGLLAPESEQQQQQLDVWGGGGAGGGACGSWVCPAFVLEGLRGMRRPACCLPSTAVLLVLMLMLPWFFMSLRYL